MSRLKIALYVVIIAAFIAAAVCLVIILKGDKILIVPQEYVSISEAMVKARAGYTVLLEGGNYNENIVLKSGVTLKGEEGQKAVITNPNNKAAIKVHDCNDVVIENIIVQYIQNDTGEPNDAIAIKDSNVRILTCRFEKAKNGININGNSNVEIRECTGSNNSKFGVFAANGASVSVSNSVFENNGLTGIAAFESKELHIKNCVSSNHLEGGFESKNTEHTSIKDSEATDNNWGIAIYPKGQDYKRQGSYVEVFGTTAANNNKYGIYVKDRQDIFIRENITYSNGGHGIACYFSTEEDKDNQTEPNYIENSQSTNRTHINNTILVDIKNNTSCNNEKKGIICYRPKNSFQDKANIQLQIVNNVAAGNGHDGISESNIKSAQVRNNISYGNTRLGFACYQSSDESVEETAIDLEGNVAASNGHGGIFCSKFSTVKARDNQCRGNREYGFALIAPLQARVEANICEDNGACGLTVQKASGQAVLADNTCRQNLAAGILVMDSENCTLENNKCDRNSNGMFVSEISSAASVNSNRCSENTKHGINCHNVKEADVFENECSNNKKSGIFISSQKNENIEETVFNEGKADIPATVKVHSNRCSENAEYGIWCSKADEVDLFENECTLNKNSGILISSDTGGKIRENVCRENFYQGIYLYKINSKIEVEENECYRNGRSGLRSRESPSAAVSAIDNEFSENFNWGMYFSKGSKAKVSGNVCEYNRYEGLFATDKGTQVDAVNNTFKGNYATGIVYCKGAAGAIESNICVNHPWSGITIRDKETSVVISNNTIGGNDCWGIAYLKGGRGELRDNIFQGNGIAAVRTGAGHSPMTPFEIYIYLHLPFGLMMQL